MKTDLIRKLLIILFIASLFNSCSLFVGQDRIKELTRTFFVGEEGTQYFIKPLEFTNDNGDEMYMDITFRYKDEIKDTAVINFTIQTSDLIKKLNTVTVSSDKVIYTTNNILLLFAEKEDEEFRSRFSIKVPMKELDKLIKNSKWVFELNHNSDMLIYYPTTGTENALKIINNDLFVLFR